MTRVYKIYKRDWYSKVSKEEREQALLIFRWKYPELIGFEGLFVYAQFFYEAYKESKRAIATKELMKHRTATCEQPLESLLSSDFLLIDNVAPNNSATLRIKDMSPSERYMLLYITIHGKKKTAEFMNTTPSEINYFLKSLLKYI
jgi:hypothetical protein